MRWLAVILGLAAWAAGPAMATPPRATMSDDRMVAATQSHLYVLRDVVDNIGSHYDELRDQHLVEISLETGEATRFWPLRRVAVSRLETGELLNPGMVTEPSVVNHTVIDPLYATMGSAMYTPERETSCTEFS